MPFPMRHYLCGFRCAITIADIASNNGNQHGRWRNHMGFRGGRMRAGKTTGSHESTIANVCVGEQEGERETRCLRMITNSSSILLTMGRGGHGSSSIGQASTSTWQSLHGIHEDFDVYHGDPSTATARHHCHGPSDDQDWVSAGG